MSVAPKISAKRRRVLRLLATGSVAQGQSATKWLYDRGFLVINRATKRYEISQRGLDILASEAAK